MPDLLVERGVEASFASIEAVNWRGMRCKVRIKSNSKGLLVDLRTNVKQASTSVVQMPKPVSLDGEVSLAVADDKYEGAAAWVVVVDANSTVVASQTTSVGEPA